MDKDRIISELILRTERLEATVAGLKRENSELRERLSKYESPKNSRNSSIPPSRDENRPKKNQSLRKRTGRKPGGQPGRKGKTLEMNAVPDHIVDLEPDYCRGCGAPLENVPPEPASRRQIVDIPPIKAVWTQYRTYGKRCGCGQRTVADFPQGADAPVSYGGNIEALIAYFHARQYLPFRRMGEMVNDVFNIDISEGGIHCLLGRFAGKATPLYREIRQRVAAAKVVGTDETGVKVDGKKHWFWTWQAPRLTYIAHSHTRGRAAVDANFPEGFPNAVLVHDGWRPQTGTRAKHHQTCLPHLLRRLNYLGQRYDGAQWGRDFKALLYDAMELHRKGDVGGSKRAEVGRRLEKLLGAPPEKEHKELFAFYKRMLRERGHLFTFLDVEGVPPDNNASERAIRNVKVKQKISGQFKTEKAARNFAKIRSVIDTTVKNGQNVLQALSLIAKLQPQMAD